MFLALFLHILIHVIFSLNSTELHFSLRMYQLQHALFGKKILHCFLYIKSNVIMNDISVFPKASLINQQQISILQYEVYLMPSLIRPLRPLILISGFYTETTTESKKSETVYYFLQSAFQPKGRTKLALLRYNLTDS